MFKDLYTEKYRPQVLDDIVLTKEEKDYFLSLKEKKEIPNLLFAGSPGTGKTSLAKIIVRDILDCQYLYINASDENGIDTIRSKVIGFSSTKSLDGKLKVVLFDECLDESTLITVLRNGNVQQIQIKDVDGNRDLVKTYNFIKERIEWRPFYKIDKGIQDVYEVEFENSEVILCTGSHKWYVKDSAGNIIRKKLIDMINEDIKEIVNLDHKI
jgi:DNA polymerase III delta prime subunit